MFSKKESTWLQALKSDRSKLKDSMEKISRRSEYWKKSNLDILNVKNEKFSYSNAEGVDFHRLNDPSFIIKGNEIVDNRNSNYTVRNYEVFEFKDIVADEASPFKQYVGEIEQKSQRLVSRPLALDNTLNALNGLVLKADGLNESVLYLDNQILRSSENQYLRNLIILEPGSSLTLVESGENDYVKNIVTEFYLKEGSQLNYINLTNFNNKLPKINHGFCELLEGAHFNYFSLKHISDK